MSQWGRPRHPGVRHNRRVRGGGTWSDQDRRLNRHQLGRLRRKKGHAETWSGQVRRLDRRGYLRDRYIAGILILGLAVVALSAGGTALIVFVVAALVVIGWHRVRPGRR
ncbi:MAG TPA: hypothetical protein VMK84_29220 [Streptosporangiaceae bacterium]|nr:hypothetical protein [Streptosporangiaceae bacterium]